MGIAERRERERQEMRQRILDAARELLVTEGYERMTMRRIAEAIEYTPTAIYHHFQDKDDVVLTLCHQDFGRLLDALNHAPPPADPIAALRALGLAYTQFALQHPNHYRFMFMTAPKVKHQLTPEDPGYQAFAMLRQVVALAAERGLLRPGSPDTFAQVLWATLHGAVALLITLEPDCFPMVPPAPDLIEQVVETGLRGILATPKPDAPVGRS